MTPLHKIKFLKSKFLLSSLTLFAAFLPKISADIDDNPIINPLNPKETIQPKNIYSPSTNIVTTINPPESFPSESYKENLYSNNVNFKPSLTSLSKPYIYGSKKKKHYNHAEQSLPAVLPTYELDLDTGGGDDNLVTTDTGMILASISGSMLIGR